MELRCFLFGLGGCGAEDVRAQQLKVLAARLRYAVAPPLADGRRLHGAESRDFESAAKGINESGVAVRGLFHGTMLGAPYTKSNRHTLRWKS